VKSRTLVILATYNERENIEPLSADVLASPIAAELLVIDDSSPDGTGEAADAIAAADARVHVIHRPGKLGLGSASILGLQYALDHGYDFAIVMDADFSHHAKYLPDLVDGMTRFDVTIGSRYVTGGGAVDWPLHRRLMSTCINLYARMCLGLKVRDCSGSYRCYRLGLMRTGVLDRMVSRGYSYLEEILYRCQSVGMKLGEVPILFGERLGGHSKISYVEAAAAVWVIFKILLGRIVRCCRPRRGVSG